jgi:sugar O-acyltransferase (sialic acid O-acetyltransferase NeuD family)
MVEFSLVPLPQLGVNEKSAKVIEWFKAEGEFVNKGEVICVAETSKSVFDIESQAAGYLIPLCQIDTEIQVGAPIAVIASEPVDKEEARKWLTEQEPKTAEAEEDRAWTYKAEALAHHHGIDLSKVTRTTGKITEQDVIKYLKLTENKHRERNDFHDLMDDLHPLGKVQRLLILGGGYGSIQILDVIVRLSHQRAVAIMDDNSALHGKKVNGVPIIGPVEIDHAVDLFERAEFDAAVISVSTDIGFRARIFEEWRAKGIPFANVIHPSVVIGTNVSWGEGNVVLAFCQIGPCSSIGHNNFISAYCSIEHHSTLGDHCSFGPGVITSALVEIGKRVRFGTGIFIEPNITIGPNSVVGSGCIIWKNISENSVLKSKLNYIERQR